MTGISYLRKAEQRLKTYEDYTICRESYGQRFVGNLKAFYSSIF
jgi:hypothetical protein